jgi:hypothetical protein
MDRLKFARGWLFTAGLIALIAAVPACGGGSGGGGTSTIAATSTGGSGGGGGDGDGADAPSVSFLGFAFRIGTGAEFTTPPIEDLFAAPPTLGAPLDLTIIFKFDGVPQGPFHQENLPVYTTPDDVTPAAGAPAATPVIPAKGTYVLVGNNVEFHPFVPTLPLLIPLSSPAAAVPGLLPASLYTVEVEADEPEKIPNLISAGGVTQFGTTSNDAAYYASGPGDGLAPVVLAKTPGDSTVDFYPEPYSNFAPGVLLPTFPPGPSSFTVTYDRGLLPTEDNLEGRDWDGDGYAERPFFLRARGTRLLVGHTVPAGSSVGNASDFSAISGLDEGTTAVPSMPPSDGSDVFLHNSGESLPLLPTMEPALLSRPGSMTAAADPSMLYVVLEVPSGEDLLTVVDHVIGDTSGANMFSGPALSTGLQELVGITTLQSGRLVGYDADPASRRIHELAVTVQRDRPIGEPTVSSVALGPFTSSAFPAGIDVIDLAQSPSGILYALVDAGATFPAIQRLHPIDFGLTGAFLATDGLPDLSYPALPLTREYSSIEFVSETEVLGLNRSDDTIDLVNLGTGIGSPVVTDVARFGLALGSLPDGLSPATSLALGNLHLDLDLTLEVNTATSAIVALDTVGVLPFGTRLDLMARPNLTSLDGASLANENPDELLSVLGAQRLMTVTTSLPINTHAPCIGPDPEGRVHDVFLEEFLDTTYEDPDPPSLNPKADWAKLLAGATPSGLLRASVGASDTAQLGDFHPVASPNFDPSIAYSKSAAQVTQAAFTFVYLDTDVQHFPLPGGVGGITEAKTVFGGDFVFNDFIIPEGVWVKAVGTNPLRITATGEVEIHGVLDVSGFNGQGDNTFDTGFTPVPGGPGGAGGGRGGHGHPTVFDPIILGQGGVNPISQYATPETGEHGLGPSIGPFGAVTFQNIGGRGGLSTMGYDPAATGYPKLSNAGNNREDHRPPGGGGGSMYYHGIKAHEGSGSYLVQSSSSWGNFFKCIGNDKISWALYGNEENQPGCVGTGPTNPIQCVYMVGTPSNPQRKQPGGGPGNLIFKDGDPSNDFIGPGGELTQLIGGQGGGGGGSRIDSMKHSIWGIGALGLPTLPPAPVCYPLLFGGTFFSPTLYDAKGGGAGGGSGSVLIKSFGDIWFSRTGHIIATGGNGEGGEIVENSIYSGAGGGGSGGAVILQAAGDIIMDADPGHAYPYSMDADGDQGASIDVSGGFGFDARTSPGDIATKPAPTFDFTRSDGGQGGFGMIQFQVGADSARPQIAQGVHLFARLRAILKEGTWTGDTAAKQAEHESWSTGNKPPNELRYIDMLHYRKVEHDPGEGTDPWVLLNGMILEPGDTPLITPDPGGPASAYQLDTKTVEHFGRRLVREPQPEKILKTYFGYDAGFNEIEIAGTPGILYDATDDIPLSVHLNEPDGTPIKKVIDGVEQFDPDNVVDRLPVVPLHLTPPAFGTVSRGTSQWLDFNGVATRTRDFAGRHPPLFSGFQGTFNTLLGLVDPAKDGQVVTGSPVPGLPAHYVTNTGFFPFDPGLCSTGSPSDPAFNDVRVAAPEFSLDDAITDNATVAVHFQGAFPVRAGSHVPDPGTETAWVSDLRDLTGYPLVRFRVTFDLSNDVANFPFGPSSFRPAVDNVRVRASY